ncbi:glycosyltransferase family 4 protein [Mycobacterium asiaticum]|uniref:Glycosyl transferase family 1 n=1 Tax=Mycobacterium asiaticum TaxID=1790 RepID=A0A1A3N772_MYCAS|nr:glycosyltransferase family 4 protein [Mycobacterium asiaticum]OBK16904.1 glycosyl transferase family 1 [Mycobacterium asiaticum]
MRPPLRIAVIAHNHFPIREPYAGGLEAHVGQLTRALVNAGHQVTLFAAAGSDVGIAHPSLTVEPLKRSTAASVPFPLPGAVKESDHQAFVTLMARLAGKNAAKYDVIHNHSLHYVPIITAARLSTPVLTTLHTPPFPLLEAAVGAVRGNGLTFAAVSRAAAATWAHVGIERLAVVPNGIDLARWPAGRGGRYLVWSGRIVPEKGPHLAIEAARRAGWRLVLAGPVVDAGFFRRQITPHLGDGVTYAGHLNQHLLASLVGGAAAALVTPLWEEPYGLVAAEAMSCGTPVVAFARGGIPELVDEHCGRLVAPQDVVAMARAIPVVSKLDRTQVRRSAIARHGVAAMAAKYVALYRNLLVDSGARARRRSA